MRRPADRHWIALAIPCKVAAVGKGISGRNVFAGATAALTLLCALPAKADEITEPRHGVSILYDGARWSGAIEDQDIELRCKAAECGGDAAECTTSITETKAGFTAKDFFDEFERVYTDAIVESFTESGWDPVVVDQPTTYLVGSSIAPISSVQYEENGDPKRVWFVEFGAPFGVLVLACYGREDRYETTRTQWLKLAEAVAVPKE